MSKAQIVRRGAIAAGAALLTIQAHEYAHGITGWALVGAAEVRASSAGAVVEMTSTEAGIQALAGPFFSLFSGLVIYLISQRLAPGFARTVMLWLGLASMMNFFGYLMTAIAGGPGDIVAAITDFGLPGWIAIVIFPLGALGMLSLSYLLCKEIRRSAETTYEMRALGIFPWIVGTADARRFARDQPDLGPEPLWRRAVLGLAGQFRLADPRPDVHQLHQTRTLPGVG